MNDLDGGIKNNLIKSEYMSDFKVIYISEKKEIHLVESLLIVLNDESEINEIAQWLFYVRKNVPRFISIVSKVDNDLLEEILLGLGANTFNLEGFLTKIALTLRNYLALAGPDQKKHEDDTGFVLSAEDGSFSFYDKKVFLTKREYSCMKLLYNHINKVVTYEELASYVWNEEVGKPRVANLIACLRKKMELNNSLMINNVSSKGYILESKKKG